MDAKEALARVSKLTKTVSDGHSKLRHDTGSGPGGHADLTLGVTGSKRLFSCLFRSPTGSCRIVLITPGV